MFIFFLSWSDLEYHSRRKNSKFLNSKIGLCGNRISQITWINPKRTTFKLQQLLKKKIILFETVTWSPMTFILKEILIKIGQLPAGYWSQSEIRCKSNDWYLLDKNQTVKILSAQKSDVAEEQFNYLNWFLLFKNHSNASNASIALSVLNA